MCYFLCTRDAITMKEAPIEETRAGVAPRGDDQPESRAEL